MHRLLIMILVLGVASSSSMAQDSSKIAPSHSMVMHGEARYSADFQHFDYVNPKAPKGGVLKQHVVGSFDSVNPFIVKGSSAVG